MEKARTAALASSRAKSALITGGDSGIGRAVALAFAREGADILISYLNQESDGKRPSALSRKKDASALPSQATFKKRVTASISSSSLFQNLARLTYSSTMRFSDHT